MLTVSFINMHLLLLISDVSRDDEKGKSFYTDDNLMIAKWGGNVYQHLAWDDALRG